MTTSAGSPEAANKKIVTTNPIFRGAVRFLAKKRSQNEPNSGGKTQKVIDLSVGIRALPRPSSW
jgi:hypothetical protein